MSQWSESECLQLKSAEDIMRLDGGIDAPHGFQNAMKKRTRASVLASSGKLRQAMSGLGEFFSKFSELFREKVLEAPGIHVPKAVLDACNV